MQGLSQSESRKGWCMHALLPTSALSALGDSVKCKLRARGERGEGGALGNLHLHTPACPSYRHTPNLGKITPTTPLTPLPPCRQSRLSDKAGGGWPETPLASPSRPPQSLQKPLPCPPRLHVSTQPPLPASPLSPSPGLQDRPPQKVRGPAAPRRRRVPGVGHPPVSTIAGPVSRSSCT